MNEPVKRDSAVNHRPTGTKPPAGWDDDTSRVKNSSEGQTAPTSVCFVPSIDRIVRWTNH
jgi:hypothetical protein